VRTTWGIATDRGQVREINEDAVLAQPPIFLVADGMGGYEAGDVASRVVVDAFRELAGRTRLSTGEIHERFQAATRELRTVLDSSSPAGSTVAGAALINQDGLDYWLIFNIGDSRVYSWQDETLSQISVDHSVVQELIDAGVLNGDDASSHPQRHQVTRALATHVDPDPDYWLIPSDAARRILICSDGLTTEVNDRDIAATLRAHSDAQDAADNLVADALAAGGRDNVSVVVVDLAPSDGAGLGVGATAVDGEDTNSHWDEQLEGATIPRAHGRK